MNVNSIGRLMEKTGNRRSFLKTAIAAAAAFILCACLPSCVSDDNNGVGVKPLLDHFSANGLKVGEVSLLNADAAHADAGFAVVVEGREIGIYKFDNTRKKQKERLAKISERGFLGVAGHKFTLGDDLAVNGTFVLVDYKANPQGDKILEAFKSFK